MRTSAEISEVAAALAEAQGILKPAVKDAVNPAFRSKYADLASVWESCREALPKLGLAVIQDVTNLDGGVAVSTRILHKSGQWIECGPLVVPMSKPDAHGLGSAVSYGKRYSLSAALGIVAEEDDDANAATKAAPAQRPAARPATTRTDVDRETGEILPRPRVMDSGPSEADVAQLHATFGGPQAPFTDDDLSGIAPTGGMSSPELFAKAEEAEVTKAQLTVAAKTLFGPNRWKVTELTDGERMALWESIAS